MVQTLENIDKSKVYVDRIEGLDEVVSDVIGDTLTGAVSTITTSDLTAGKILVSDNNGKVAASNKTISDIGGDSDNLSITKNASNKLQTIGVINQNATTTAIKTWTGTKAQYDAIVTKDSATLYNITDDASGTMNVYNKAEVDTLLNNKANNNLSNVSIPHLISFETDGTQWCKKYSNGWCEQFCVYSRDVILEAFVSNGYTWPLYQPITTFVSGHASIGGNAACYAADVYSNSSTYVGFYIHNANTIAWNGTLVGKYYVEAWL